MSLHAALAAAATLVSLAFALSHPRALAGPTAPPRGARGRSRSSCSPLGSLALWVGAAHRLERVVVQGLLPVRRHPERPVPRPRHGRTCWPGHGADDGGPRIVSLLAAFAAGIVVGAPLDRSLIDPDVLPQGSEVFGAGPRIAAAVGVRRRRHGDLRRRRVERVAAASPGRSARRRSDVDPRRPPGRWPTCFIAAGHARAQRRRPAQLRGRRDGRLRHLARRRHRDHLRRLPASPMRQARAPRPPCPIPGLARAGTDPPRRGGGTGSRFDLTRFSGRRRTAAGPPRRG